VAAGNVYCSETQPLNSAGGRSHGSLTLSAGSPTLEPLDYFGVAHCIAAFQIGQPRLNPALRQQLGGGAHREQQDEPDDDEAELRARTEAPRAREGRESGGSSR